MEKKQEISRDTADYIDKHIVLAMVEISKQKPFTLENMEKSFAAGRSYGYSECALGYGVDFPKGTPEENKPQLFEKWIKTL
jgi:hypothetical protein